MGQFRQHVELWEADELQVPVVSKYENDQKETTLGLERRATFEMLSARRQIDHTAVESN